MSTEKGRKGEEQAAQYLLEQGIEILERNFHGSIDGEIDIIAKEGDIYAFIEVKAFKVGSATNPLAAVTISKQRKIINTAQHFLARNNLIQVDCRFDVLVVRLSGEEVVEFNRVKDAFR